jgi:hypothetical protein
LLIILREDLWKNGNAVYADMFMTQQPETLTEISRQTRHLKAYRMIGFALFAVPQKISLRRYDKLIKAG